MVASFHRVAQDVMGKGAELPVQPLIELVKSCRVLVPNALKKFLICHKHIGQLNGYWRKLNEITKKQIHEMLANTFPHRAFAKCAARNCKKKDKT